MQDYWMNLVSVKGKILAKTMQESSQNHAYNYLCKRSWQDLSMDLAAS